MLWLVRTAIVALYPSGGSLPGAADTGLEDFLRRFRRESPRLVWAGVVLGAVAFHLTPLFTVIVPLPAFLLPAGLKDRHAARIGAAQVYLVRQLIFLLKMAAGLCWGADPEVRKRLAQPPLPPDPGTWRTS